MNKRRTFLLAGASLPAALTAPLEKAHGMATYNTGNPIGSSSFKDLFDNAHNFDNAVNNRASSTWLDRFGVARKSWWGIEQDFQSFLLASGYQDIGDYGAGLVITARNQVFARAGELYRAGPGLALPYTTTGDWASEGASFVAVGDAVLRQELADPQLGDSLVAHKRADGQDTEVGDELRAHELALAANSSLSGFSALRSSIETGSGDVFILLQGDSTGNEAWEFYRQLASKLAAMFPAWGVSYIAWNHAETAWLSPEVVQAGSNGLTIHMYNGSHAGAVPSYWRAGRTAMAYDNKHFDLILSNYGLNAPTSYEGQVYCLAEYLMDLRHDQPNAVVSVIVQPPDYTNAEMLQRSRNRLRAQRWVASQYGCPVIDAYGLFLGLVESTGNPDDWYIDKIHPNQAGQDELANLVFNSVLLSGADGVRQPSGLGSVIVPNGVFAQWPNGGDSAPLFWQPSGGVVQNTINYESGNSSARFLGVGSGGTGVAFVVANDLVRNYRQLPGFWVAARIFTLGFTNKPGTLYLSRNANTAPEEITSNRYFQEYIHGGWRWIMLYVPASFTQGHSDFRLGFYSGESGEQVNVDRILISSGPFFDDFNGEVVGGFKRSFLDTAFDVPANGVVSRGFGFPESQPGAAASARLVGQNASLITSAIAGASWVQLTFFNPAASPVTQGAYEVEISVS